MPRPQIDPIRLTPNECAYLKEQTKHGSWTPREVLRAKILLLADLNGPHKLQDEEIKQRLECSLGTIWYRRKRFSTTKSVEATIFDKKRSGRPKMVDGAVDAHITTIACCTPPTGHSSWTLRLIKDRLVTLEIVDSISHTTVGRTLKKKKSNRG